MHKNWKTYKLSELTSVITKGTTPSTYGYDFLDSGINYIRAQSLNYDGRINEDVFSFISNEAHQKLKRSQLMIFYFPWLEPIWVWLEWLKNPTAQQIRIKQ